MYIKDRALLTDEHKRKLLTRAGQEIGTQNLSGLNQLIDFVSVFDIQPFIDQSPDFKNAVYGAILEYLKPMPESLDEVFEFKEKRDSVNAQLVSGLTKCGFVIDSMPLKVKTALGDVQTPTWDGLGVKGQNVIYNDLERRVAKESNVIDFVVVSSALSMCVSLSLSLF